MTGYGLIDAHRTRRLSVVC